MKKVYLLITTLILSTTLKAEVASKNEKCNGTTIQIAECLTEKMTLADSQLNLTYNKMLTEIKDPKQKELLKKSQLAWLDHMNKEITFIQSYFSGGTYTSIRVGYSKIDFLEKRTHELAELMRP